MNKIVKEYTHFRNIGKELNTKMMNCKEIEIDIKGTGKKLKMMEGNTLVFENEDESEILMDFALFEILVNDKNFTERYYELDLPETTDEGIVLEARLEAFTSLFEVVDFDKKNCTIYIIDLLDNNKKYSFIDIGFSQTAKVGMLVFTRIIPFNDFNMTGGVSFVYNNNKKDMLISGLGFQKFKSNNKLKSADKYLLFYTMNKTNGLDLRKQNIL